MMRAAWWVVGIVAASLLLTGRRYRHPVPGARVTDAFGPRVHPVTGRVHDHNGVDFAAPTGTPVLSPGHGVVASRYWHDRGGLSLVVMLDDGFRAGFAHLSAQDVKEGDRVYPGQQIGRVGSTGVATGSHLHFTMSRDGVFVDPLTLI